MENSKVQQIAIECARSTVRFFEVASLSKNFGGIQALNGVDLTLTENSIVALIGPNGAGKSTFINVTTGIYSPDSGAVHFRDKDIAGWQAHEITKQGIARHFSFRNSS